MSVAKQHKTPLAICDGDRKDIEALYAAIKTRDAQLVGSDGETRNLPPSLHQFLVDLVDALAEGRSLAIIQQNAKLTTVQASSILGVSRQFLVNELEKRSIPFHMVGTHRRIYARDLLKYKAERDQNRRKVLRELVEAEVEDGMYEDVPPLDGKSR